MRILEVVGICFCALLALILLFFFRRRLLMGGGGSIRLQVRLSTMVPGRGWSNCLGRFVGDDLRVYRVFTFGFRPKRVLNRRMLVVDARRLPEGAERLTIPGHWVVLTCRSPLEIVEIAMADATVTGFSSWLEAGPPGPPGTQTMPPRHGGPAHNPS